MAMKQEQHQIKGMQRDLTVSKFSPEYAYENMNIRITAREHNTLLSVTNEKGTKEIKLILDNELICLKGHIENGKVIIVADKPVKKDVHFYIEAEAQVSGDPSYSTTLTGYIEEGHDTATNQISGANIIKLNGVYLTNKEPQYDDSYQYYTEYQPAVDVPVNSILGTPLGSCNVGEYVVLFTKDTSTGIDYIYRLTNSNGNIKCATIYHGDISFNVEHPIQALASYENEDIQKVYWVDGINQARVINVINRDYVSQEQFNFLRQITNNEVINISKTYGVGSFHSGVIQYAISYYITNSQESAIIYSSPLYYITPEGRGGSPDEICNCAFKIKVANADLSFDGINVYSIHRTSLDAEPSVRLVSQMPVKKGQNIVVDLNDSFTVDFINTSFKEGSNSIKVYKDDKIHDLSEYEYTVNSAGRKIYKFTFEPQEGIIITSALDGSIPYLYHDSRIQLSMANVEARIDPLDSNQITVYKAYMSNIELIEVTDTGVGSTVDPSELLYKGGEEITPYTIAQKDNTLFLGNLVISRSAIPKDIRDKLYETKVTPNLKPDYVEPNDFSQAGTFYPYVGYMDMNSYNATTFKTGEEYRPGLVFLHKTGKWSEAIPLEDALMTKVIESTKLAPSYKLTEFTYVLNSEIEKSLMELGYIAAKPVVVYPSLADRNIICQGAVCPTINIRQDRDNNSPYAASSWFARTKIVSNNRNFEYHNSNGTIVNGAHGCEFSMKQGETVEIQSSPPAYSDEEVFTVHSPDVEFDSSIRPYMKNANMRIVGYSIVRSNAIDYSILGNGKFRTDGTGNYPYNAIQCDMSTVYDTYSMPSAYGAHRRLVTAPLWRDGLITVKGSSSSSEIDTGSGNTWYAAHAVYPWQRETSLNNDFRGAEGSAILSKKVMSTLLYNDTFYFDKNNWYEFKVDGDTYLTGVAGLEVFDSNELSIIKLPVQENSTDDTQKTYQGNYSKALQNIINGTTKMWNFLSSSRNKTAPLENNNFFYNDCYTSKYIELSTSPISLTVSSPSYYTVYPKQTSYDASNIQYKSTPHIVGILNKSLIKGTVVLPQVSPADTELYSTGSIPYPSKTFDLKYVYSGFPPVSDADEIGIIYLNGQEIPGYTGKYRGNFYILKGKNPTVWEDYAPEQNGETGCIYSNTIHIITKRHNEASYTMNILKYESNVFKDDISYLFPTDSNTEYGIFLIVDIYQNSIPNKFGGKNESAYSNNIWIPAGETVKFSNDSDKTIHFQQGDTFFQRYDHLKTYSYSDNAKNNVIEILSFMCETRVNIDGRYDRNRGQKSNLSISPQNFNLFNPVYSQKNPFFSHTYLPYNMISVSRFPNTVTWTKEKTNGASIDVWTSITMASTLDVDGDKGKIISLNTLNNEIFCFQEQGLSNIIFNPRVQIPVSDGVPVEVGNSYKVQGKRYISNIIGCNNKWSICQTPAGIYFIDNLTNGLYTFDGQSISSLSDKLGFRQFINANNSLERWNPVDFKNFRTFYDKTNDDIYFINDKYCLTYSELLNQFTSFMSYEKTPIMFNYKDKFYAVNKNKMWEINGGDYNMFYGEFKPYYVTIVANQDEPIDKIFNTIEYRADVKRDGVLMPNETFTQLDVWNEYQHGTLELTNKIGYPSPLKRKFRVWRANIPRDNGNRNRIRNTWAYVKLQMNKESTDSMELHDVNVGFYE